MTQEWPSQNRMPARPGVHFAIDGLDWKTQAPQHEQPGFRELEGTTFSLCIIVRATRELHERPLRTRGAGATKEAVLSRPREAEATETIKDPNC